MFSLFSWLKKHMQSILKQRSKNKKPNHIKQADSKHNSQSYSTQNINPKSTITSTVHKNLSTTHSNLLHFFKQIIISASALAFYLFFALLACNQYLIEFNRYNQQREISIEQVKLLWSKSHFAKYNILSDVEKDVEHAADTPDSMPSRSIAANAKSTANAKFSSVKYAHMSGKQHKHEPKICKPTICTNQKWLSFRPIIYIKNLKHKRYGKVEHIFLNFWQKKAILRNCQISLNLLSTNVLSNLETSLQFPLSQTLTNAFTHIFTNKFNLSISYEESKNRHMVYSIYIPSIGMLRVRHNLSELNIYEKTSTEPEYKLAFVIKPTILSDRIENFVEGVGHFSHSDISHSVLHLKYKRFFPSFFTTQSLNHTIGNLIINLSKQYACWHEYMPSQAKSSSFNVPPANVSSANMSLANVPLSNKPISHPNPKNKFPPEPLFITVVSSWDKSDQSKNQPLLLSEILPNIIFPDRLKQELHHKINQKINQKINNNSTTIIGNLNIFNLNAFAAYSHTFDMKLPENIFFSLYVPHDLFTHRLQKPHTCQTNAEKTHTSKNAIKNNIKSKPQDSSSHAIASFCLGTKAFSCTNKQYNTNISNFKLHLTLDSVKDLLVLKECSGSASINQKLKKDSKHDHQKSSAIENIDLKLFTGAFKLSDLISCAHACIEYAFDAFDTQHTKHASQPSIRNYYTILSTFLQTCQYLKINMLYDSLPIFQTMPKSRSKTSLKQSNTQTLSKSAIDIALDYKNTHITSFSSKQKHKHSIHAASNFIDSNPHASNSDDSKPHDLADSNASQASGSFKYGDFSVQYNISQTKKSSYLNKKLAKGILTHSNSIVINIFNLKHNMFANNSNIILSPDTNFTLRYIPTSDSLKSLPTKYISTKSMTMKATAKQVQSHAQQVKTDAKQIKSHAQQVKFHAQQIKSDATQSKKTHVPSKNAQPIHPNKFLHYFWQLDGYSKLTIIKNQKAYPHTILCNANLTKQTAKIRINGIVHGQSVINWTDKTCSIDITDMNFIWPSNLGYKSAGQKTLIKYMFGTKKALLENPEIYGCIQYLPALDISATDKNLHAKQCNLDACLRDTIDISHMLDVQSVAHMVPKSSLSDQSNIAHSNTAQSNMSSNSNLPEKSNLPHQSNTDQFNTDQSNIAHSNLPEKNLSTHSNSIPSSHLPHKNSGAKILGLLYVRQKFNHLDIKIQYDFAKSTLFVYGTGPYMDGQPWMKEKIDPDGSMKMHVALDVDKIFTRANRFLKDCIVYVDNEKLFPDVYVIGQLQTIPEQDQQLQAVYSVANNHALPNLHHEQDNSLKSTISNSNKFPDQTARNDEIDKSGTVKQGFKNLFKKTLNTGATNLIGTVDHTATGNHTATGDHTATVDHTVYIMISGALPHRQIFIHTDFTKDFCDSLNIDLPITNCPIIIEGEMNAEYMSGKAKVYKAYTTKGLGVLKLLQIFSIGHWINTFMQPNANFWPLIEAKWKYYPQVKLYLDDIKLENTHYMLDASGMIDFVSDNVNIDGLIVPKTLWQRIVLSNFNTRSGIRFNIFGNTSSKSLAPAGENKDAANSTDISGLKTTIEHKGQILPFFLP